MEAADESKRRGAITLAEVMTRHGGSGLLARTTRSTAGTPCGSSGRHRLSDDFGSGSRWLRLPGPQRRPNCQAPRPPHRRKTGRSSTPEQWDAFLLARIEEAKWSGHVSGIASPESRAYAESIRPNRERLAHAVGAVDPRVVPVQMELLGTAEPAGPLVEHAAYSVWPARWPVLDGVFGEGLFFQPKGAVKGFVVSCPMPTSCRRRGRMGARCAAESRGPAGRERPAPWWCSRWPAATAPSLRIQRTRYRRTKHTANWLYRQAAPVGRHIIGYEVQKARAAIDWFLNTPAGRGTPVGVIGYGEGGLLALRRRAR